jgi:hypothetical protein
MTASVRDQSSARVRAVDDAFESAEGAWTGVGISLGSLIGVTPQSQVLNAIRQMKTLGRDPWVARRDKLSDGDVTGWARWIQDGNDLLKNLSSTAQDANTASLQGIVIETVTASAQDVRTAAVSVWQSKYLIIAGLALVAIIVWRMKAGK